MSIRTLNWFESEADNTNIANNNWNFQVAKAVAAGSAAPTYNLVWQSRGLAPGTSISWKVEYALGWTATVPSSGVQVRIVGNWQPCNKGESFDINPQGYWTRSTTPSDPNDAGWLKVGTINYSYPGVLGLHMVVGMRNAQTNRFDPIFIDNATLGPGSSARYQPQETVSWWLESKDLTGQVFSNTKSASTSQDFTNPSDPLTKSYEWSTSFITVGSKWVIAPGPPPQSLMTPPPSAQLAALSLGGPPPVTLQLDHANWIVTFAVPLATGLLAAAASALYAKLKDKFKKVEISIEGTDGTKLLIRYEAGNGGAPGTVAFLGMPLGSTGGPVDTIDEALQAMLRGGELPNGESWSVSPSTRPLSQEAPSNGSGGNFSSGALGRQSDFNQQPSDLRYGNGTNGYQQDQQQPNFAAKAIYT